MASDDTPRGTNPLVWLLGIFTVGVAALFGLQRPTDHPQPTQSSAESAKDEKKVEPPAEPEASVPLQFLQDYLRVTGGEADRSPKPNLRFQLESDAASLTLSVDGKGHAGRGQPRLSETLLVEPAEYEFLIATVPDPVESKFPHEFDAVVDGIQRAFEARDFILRASRMPWPRGRERAAPATDTNSAPRHREYPGVLLFRKSRDPQLPSDNLVYTLVCLVGESPVGGIHKPAMLRALEARDALGREIDDANKSNDQIKWADAKNPKSPPKVRIVAPYFTGSQSSLIRTLRWWWDHQHLAPLAGVCGYPVAPTAPPPPVRIISGSATALNPALFTKARLPAPETTVIPIELVTQAVFHYLSGQRGQSLDKLEADDRLGDRVAILRESNTGFGAQVSFSSGAPQHPQDSDKYPYQDCLKQPPFDLPFPMSISQLHVDLERNSKPLLPQTGFVEPRLPVRDQTHLDAIPPYDPEAAAATAGQSLRMILTTIERARVRYVGIVATDARDVVFLNRLLRKECPNVRVFTAEPSIALLHPDEAYHLRGMVVGSTYPLAPVTQYWGRTGASRGPSMIPFPMQGSQGYYNAVLAHFGKPELMLGYRPPLIPDVQQHSRPPIWISVVGQGGRLVPVHCYAEYKTESDRYPKLIESPGPQNSEDGRPNRKPVVGVPIGVLLGSLGAVLALAAVILALTPRVWQRRAGGLTRAEAEHEHLPDLTWVWIWRGVMLAGILLFALPYAIPAGEVVQPCCGATAWRQRFVFGMAVVLTLQIVALFVLLALRGWRTPPARSWESRWGYRGLAALVLAAGLGALFWRTQQGPAERFFLYVRATDLSAGLSPVIPMGLVGAAAFALGWCCLRQADLSRRTRLRCPYPFPWTRVVSADDELRADLRNHIRFAPNALTLALAVPFLLCFVWNAFIIPLPSGEGPAWDWTMRLTFWVTAGAVVLTLARFLTLWARLSRLLGEILRVPMVAAFERLPHEIGRLFGGYLYSQRPRHRQLAAAAWALPVEARLELAEQIAKTRPGLAWVFGRAGAPPTRIDRRNPEREEELDQADRKWLADWLQKKAGEYLTELPGEWKTQSTDEAFGSARRKEKPEAEGKSTRPGGGEHKHPDKHPPEPTTAEKEDYVAALVVMYLGGYFAQLRMLVYAVAAAAPLLLFAAASYPFQPDRPRLLALVGLLTAIAIGTAYVLYRINKDGLVSRISRTTPDRFTPDAGFFSSLLTYVLPVLAIVVLQVLGLFRFIVEPILGLFE